MQHLREQKVGHVYAEGKTLPGVAGAIIYDLEQGADFAKRLEVTPDRKFGYEAAKAARSGPVRQGSVGAGTGAGTDGPGLRLKGGVGTASLNLGNGVTVAAFVVVNSFGKAYDETRGCELYSLHLEVGNEFGNTRRPPAGCQATTPSSKPADRPSADVDKNTTIGVVATNAKLTAPQVQKLAQVAHGGLARAIRPAHTMSDGDTIFGVSTKKGAEVGPADFNRLLEGGANAFGRAVAHAVLSAQPVAGRPTYCQTFPGACDGYAPASAPADDGAQQPALAAPAAHSGSPGGGGPGGAGGDLLSLAAPALVVALGFGALMFRRPLRRLMFLRGNPVPRIDRW
ncbi:Peptidase family S58 [Streptoalloteichus hindustanus]|uniref:Peptidase family S58 n=1 Tax=Streptoalloteichus hindustanus TaxID=2017 RepID=A0A1M5CXY3_STRHI|nr:Peptidase family S58 [Streptoalloteichus hindustanus]